jgi:hypothetical protein
MFLQDESDVEDCDHEIEEYVLRCQRKRRQIAAVGAMLGMYYFDTYLDKAPYRVPAKSGYDLVMRTLGNSTSCYNMFRMNRDVFDKLHNVLVKSYGLKSTTRMSAVEALGLFLWIVGAPQSMRQAEDHFVRSTETCSRKFEKVLHSVSKLAAEIIRPLDPEFSTVHQRLQSLQFSPYFDNCIGEIDGTHIKVVVPTNKVTQHMGRKGYTSQNMMAVCDFDMGFTFVVAGRPGLVHDMRVFKDAITKYGDKFPHPPQGNSLALVSQYFNPLYILKKS